MSIALFIAIARSTRVLLHLSFGSPRNLERQTGPLRGCGSVLGPAESGARKAIADHLPSWASGPGRLRVRAVCGLIAS